MRGDPVLLTPSISATSERELAIKAMKPDRRGTVPL